MARKAQFTLAAISDLDNLREHIEAFGTWLARQDRGWTVRPPVSVYSPRGDQMLTFVVLHHDQVFGVFTSPMHALVKMGDPELTSAYQEHMRDRRMLVAAADLFRRRDH